MTESTSLTHEFKCTIRFRTQFNLRKIKKVISSPWWLLFPHSMECLQCSSHQQTQRKQQCFSPLQERKSDSSTVAVVELTLALTVGILLDYCLWEKIALIAQFRVFLFCMENTEYIKAKIQVKQVTHYTKVSLQEIWSPWQPFMGFLHLTLV